MSYSIGIDLGTTNSVVCVWQRGMVKTIPVDGRPTLPSTISVKPDGSVLVGQMAKSRALLEPTQSVSSAKRVIGDGVTTWTLHGEVYTPTEISALVLKRLKAAAESYLGEAVTDAVITVPAYFNNNQKEATRKAGEQAGLRVLQLLPEPTAAAISYGLDKGRDQTILVYDLGGGTFDVSILKVKGNHFEVVAVDGDFHLGGDDFDNLLVEYLIRRLNSQATHTEANFDVLKEALDGGGQATVSPQVLQARLRLKEVAENAKKELSEAEVTHVIVPEILGTSLDEEITLETYNQLIEPLVEYSLTKVQDVLKAARLTADDIDRVILVGGSTRNRLVKQRVSEAIKEPYTAERVDEVVAQGAAIVAASLALPQESDLTPAELGPLPPIEFRNVTPFSLGVCALKDDRSRYLNSVILQQNREVPCTETRPYALDTRPGAANRLEVYMLQGEGEDPAECLALGKYVFSDITHQASGQAEIAIRYGYDASGIITVSAIEQATGKTLPLSIEPLPENPPWRQGLPIAQTGFDPQSLKLYVTMKMYDDIAKVLKSMNLPFKKYPSGTAWKDGDILFINCGTLRHPKPKDLREYALRGGCIYASDLEADVIQEAFGEEISFKYISCRKETISAEVMDPEIAVFMGSTIDIYYDVAACYEIKKMSPNVQVILRNQKTKEPIMVTFPVGERGKVFYTLFHNHAQASQKEQELLQLLLMKQISAVSGIPIEIVRQAIQQ